MRQQACKRNQGSTNYTYRLFLWPAKTAILKRRRTIDTSAHTQIFKIHLKYIKLIYAFGSAHVKIGVWIKAGPQPLIGTLRKTLRQRQRERDETKGLISRTIAVHVHYNSGYISLPSSAKQQREMTKFCVVWRTWTAAPNFSYFYLELNAFVAYSAGASFNTDKHTK